MTIPGWRLRWRSAIIRGIRRYWRSSWARAKNKDRRDRLQYLLPSLSNEVAVRDSFFMTLGSAEARRKEAWVLAALANLHHPLRVDSSEKYLARSLEWLADIQRTGMCSFRRAGCRRVWVIIRRQRRRKLCGSSCASIRIIIRSCGQRPSGADNLFRAGKLIAKEKSF